MRKLLLTATLSCAVVLGFSQYYYVPFVGAGTNPGGLNADSEYPSGGGQPAGWNHILLGSAATPVWSANQTLPFSFSFNGSPVTQYKVSSSGVLTFDVSTGLGAPSYTAAALPSASIPDESVCIWGLNAAGSNDYVSWKVFGSAPNRQYWIHFSSYGYGASVSDGSNFTYWAIALEETSNNIYIVDQRTGGFTVGTAVVSAGVQINGSTAASVLGSPTLGTQATTDPTPADNTYYMFVQGTQPAYDMAATDITNNPFLGLPSAPFTITGDLFNYGTSTITSFDINYRVNGGSTVTSTVNSVSIASFGSYAFSHPTSWNPGSAGTYTVEVWASNLNGNADQNMSNDIFSKQIEVLSAIVPRIILHEVFSSSTCAPCNPGNVNLHGIQNANPGEFVAVKYQMSWPGTGDPYYLQPDGEDRRNYYAINSIPWMMVDGGWDGNSQSYTQAIMDGFEEVPSVVGLSGTYSVQGQTVTVDADIDPVADVSGSLRLHIAVVESITYNNVKTNGETEFHDVMKKMIPNASGTTVPALVDGVQQSFHKEFTFPGGYTLPPSADDGGTTYLGIDPTVEHSVEDFGSLKVALFLQNQTTKEVYQAAWATEVVGVDEPQGVASIKTYPNPANDRTNVELSLQEAASVSVSVFDMVGKEVYHNNLGSMSAGKTYLGLNTADWASGVYNVTLTIGGETVVTKVTVSH